MFSALRVSTLRLLLLLCVQGLGASSSTPVAAQSARSYLQDDLGEIPRVSVEDGGPRNWEVVVEGVLNMRDAASTRGEVVTELESGTLLDNLGCREAEGRTWCDVQELGGGPRGYVAADYLRPALSPDGSAWAGPDHSAFRAGISDFDARGSIRCGTEQSPLTDECLFGVARSGGGYATVVITRLDGGTRALYFTMGIPIGAELSQADPSDGFETDRRDDSWLVWVGNSVYEIPDSAVLGG